MIGMDKCKAQTALLCQCALRYDSHRLFIEAYGSHKVRGNCIMIVSRKSMGFVDQQTNRLHYKNKNKSKNKNKQ